MRVIQFIFLALLITSKMGSAKEPNDLPLLIDNLRSDVKSLIKKPNKCDGGISSIRTDRASALFDLMDEAPNKIIEYKNKFDFDEPSEIDEYRNSMEAWSLYNIDDYQTYQKMIANQKALSISLSHHYKKEFGYSAAEAQKEANKVIEIVLVRVFTSFDYAPITNKHFLGLRKAILAKSSIEDIRQYTDKNKLQNPFDSNIIVKDHTVYRGYYYSRAIEKESLLSIAIDYPQALEHLLKIGIDPNHKNSFGKTPLMYAAQRNQLESTKILLKYGAKINDATTHKIIGYSCFHTLSQYGVTALHYAVRYSDKALIDFLLSEGASIYNSSSQRSKTSKVPLGLPYQWLDFRERQSNNKELADLKKMLMPEKHNKQINQDK